MAITNQERIGKAMDILREGLKPFVERECSARLGKYWITAVTQSWPHDLSWKEGEADPQMDSAILLRIMWEQWNAVFREILGHAERSLVSELRDVRNKWAHQEPFSGDDTDRALDSIQRLLVAISSPLAEEIGKMKMDLRRLIFDEQVRGEKRKAGGTLVESTATGAFKPWREVVTPHRDVASGRYQQAEFAADLWQVYIGQGEPEYKDSAEFFRRTYLTESLKRLLICAVRRVSAAGGDPVVQLQTNFGGGKTHSMLALYHLFSGSAPGDLAGVDSVMADAGVKALPKVKRVVLVGNRISPGNPVTKPDGTVVRTLWGELAYQLGGKKAFARIAADDEKATSPGDALRELMVEYGPCLILIDEWVAYARMLHEQADLSAGSFETQFTFAQALTESAKLAKNCLLVISLPASDTSGSPHTQADDSEVGGVRGREALDRLRNVIGRLESSWRPATAEESFEIVRRRLFEPLAGPDQFKQRDVTARAFAELYRAHPAEFPPECREKEYEKRIQAAYPIHPEIFDRLYGDWSTLVKFQRTRGVLRLMAAVINSLWEKGDKNPLILPSLIPIDDARVQNELTRYLSDNWVPIIEKDVDGPSSLPWKIDAELPGTLGKLNATRRVARAIYLGSAPTAALAHRGLEDRRVNLGCVMPGEPTAVFSDALRRLTASATFLYQDGPRYWYSTQPTVTKLAEDRADQLKRDADKVAQELDKRLRADLRTKGDFHRVHPMPSSGQDLPDELDARLVVLTADHPYSKEAGNPAEVAATAMLESRGNTPRLYRNTLVFLAADRPNLQDLEDAVRRYLAWESIVKESEQLNLDPHQKKQAETQLEAAESVVNARLPETYQWLLVPVQEKPQSPVSWQALRLTGQESLAVRASKKLKSSEELITTYGATRLKLDMDTIPLWRGDCVQIKQLVEDYARYLYLPRLADPSVLLAAVRDGISSMMWETETFAFAERYDEAAGRYLGLRVMQRMEFTDPDSTGVLVKPDVARKQMDADAAARQPAGAPTAEAGGAAPLSPLAGGSAGKATPPPAVQPTRFHGTVVLNATRAGRDAGQIADEVISHLAGLVGAKVTISMEIEADVPNGVPENIVRIVTENCRTLKFTSQGFEKE